MPRLQTGDGTVFTNELAKQGFSGKWFEDSNGYGSVDFGDCTLENYKKMATYGAITIISHGMPGKHLAVYAPPTPAGEAACNAWRTNEVGMTTQLYADAGGRFYCVEVDTSWFTNNWKTSLDNNNAIVMWSICYSASNCPTAGISIKDAAGGRWRSGYELPTHVLETSDVNRTLLQRMNGTVGNGNLRTAGQAYNDSTIIYRQINPAWRFDWDDILGRYMRFVGSVKMDGDWWTTLCPAPLEIAPVYPASPVNENRKGWGCVLLDTALDDTPPAKDAMVKTLGGVIISDEHWLKDTEGNFYGIGFTFDKSLDNSTATMEALSDKIRSKIKDIFSGPRQMDGDRVQPNTDDKQWSY